MKRSQNGWPVVGVSAIVDRAILGVEFPNGWLKGDVDVVFTYLIGRLHREVEPMMDPGCWGWFVKNIEGSSTISNHASATAIDYNAPRHPMGVRNTYNAGDRAKIRAILRDLGGVVRWGGDYSGRPDDMHFEIDDDAAAVRAAARKVKGEDMTPDELLDYDDVPNPYNDVATNPKITVRSALKAAAQADATTRDTAAAVKAIRDEQARQRDTLAEILAKLDQLPPVTG